ncbi:acyltransferase [Shewanella sp. BF02_Schw]|uniref:acyltransferase family protein n=1 Tax=Shewanella sp. BF02_Schw TaxID=394908 RepID=UPI00178479EA|nr:acyltransferase [Shewanella sp. BF02_Schw]MBO1895823.1 acyltransferase [Shewanella sp. BF02_Schw]
MDYRREIDGLRALAVVPVILFHAGIEVFKGGFVGVDVFFVISGYLITTIILSELEQKNFSIVKFYERRARRILPALFIVMLSCLVVGYFTLMPDEFKNLGQSLVATSLFSNNIFLAITSGYWDLASEFKPLLHTWSLGVEEQYYVFIPFILLFAWKYCKSRIPLILVCVFIGSFIFAVWFMAVSPQWAFYILPARAWEISIGGLASLFLRSNYQNLVSNRASNLLSFIGLLFVVTSIFVIDKTISSLVFYLLIPTIGATLIIVFTRVGSFTHFFLGHRSLVFLGLLSYSLYLWHQSVFAFLRIYSVEKPSIFAFIVSIVAIFVLSYLSWKFIETPFRNRKLINRYKIFYFSIVGNIFFIACGFYLNISYGVPSRVFNSTIRVENIDKRIYNEKVFAYKLDSFSNDRRKKLLIIGDSFARDFTNITLETYNIQNVDIIYRDDIGRCIFPYKNSLSEQLFSKANVIIFSTRDFKNDCIANDIKYAENNKKIIFYVGTKNFGYNLNWLIRFDDIERRNRYNIISDNVLDIEYDMRDKIPPENYISLLSYTLVSNKVPITDDFGHIISSDREHLTMYGAIYFGQNLLNTPYSDIFK